MNFQDLLAKMQELDQPVPEAVSAETKIEETPVLDATVTEEPNEGNEFSGELAKAKAAGQKEFEVDGKKYQVKEDGTVEECPMAPTPVGQDDGPKPTVSINLNAQGIDDIAELMKLVAKVNPGMEKPEAPAAITPLAMPSNDRPELPPLKMLPDLDKEEATEPESEDDDIMTHLNKELKPFDDQQAKDKEKDEAFGNSEQGDAGPNVKDTEYMINKLAGGMNRPKGQFKHSYQAGDNPMSMPEGDLRAAIRAELLQRLSEAKGAK